MTTEMHAAVVEQFGKPLVLRKTDVTSPAADQIVVKTDACGVCHPDLHAANGDWPLKPRPPFVPGHKHVAEALAFAVDGEVKADIELVPLSAINAVFGRLTHNDVPSRVVIDFTRT
jgi:D-arabinose 1-dehydrogenase-like Zn-dependent alcohol dehydrogenase